MLLASLAFCACSYASRARLWASEGMNILLKLLQVGLQGLVRRLL